MSKRMTLDNGLEAQEEMTDIRDVAVDPALPREERIAEFLKQIGNPYHFRCGKFTVYARYADSGYTLEECLKQILL